MTTSISPLLLNVVYLLKGESGWCTLYAKAPKVTWVSLLLPFFLVTPATQTSTAGFCLPGCNALSVCWCGPLTCGRRWHTCPSEGGRWSHPVIIQGSLGRYLGVFPLHAYSSFHLNSFFQYNFLLPHANKGTVIQVSWLQHVAWC